MEEVIIIMEVCLMEALSTQHADGQSSYFYSEAAFPIEALSTQHADGDRRHVFNSNIPKSGFGASCWTACPVEAVKSCTRRRRTPHHTPTRHCTLHAASDLRPEGADLRPEGALHDSSREGCEDHQQDDHKNNQACASLDAQPTAAFRPPTVTTSQVHRLPGRQSAP